MTDKSLMEVMETQRLDLNEAMGLPRQATHVAAAQRARVLSDAELMLLTLLTWGEPRLILRGVISTPVMDRDLPKLTDAMRAALRKELAA